MGEREQDGPRGLGRAIAVQCVALAAFFALAVVHTWPLARDWRTHLAGGVHEDPWMNVWHLDWVRQALASGRSPFFADGLHAPLGAELYWHTLSLSKSTWGLVLAPRVGLIGTYNIVIFSTFVLTGMTTFWLAGDVLRRAGARGTPALLAAFVGACVLAFSRFHLAHAVGHMNLASIEGLPLYLLFFFRYLEDGRRRWLAGAAVTAGYVAFCDFYFVYYLGVFSAAWVAVVSGHEGPLLWRVLHRRTSIRRASAIAIASALGCLPAVWPLLMHLSPRALELHHGDSDYPADPVLLAMPDALSAWRAALPDVMERAVARVQDSILNDVEGGLFVGLAAPALAVVALRAKLTGARRLAGIALAFALLSLGPYLHIGGIRELPPVIVPLLLAVWVWRSKWLAAKPYARVARWALSLACAVAAVAPLAAYGAGARMSIPMPYLLFKHLVPLFGRGGMPARFLLMTQLCLALLAALGAYRVLRSRPARRVALFAGLALVVNAEMKSVAFPMSPVPPAPSAFAQITNDPSHIAVLTDHVRGQWEQTVHHRNVSFARQSRLPVRERAFVGAPLMRAVVDFDGLRDLDASARADLREAVHAGGYRYVVLHREAIELAARRLARDAETLDTDRRAFMRDVLAARSLHDTRAMQVYALW